MRISITSAVTELLQRESIAYDVIEIPLTEDKKPIRNLEELLSKRGIDPQSVVRSVVFKTSSDCSASTILSSSATIILSS